MAGSRKRSLFVAAAITLAMTAACGTDDANLFGPDRPSDGGGGGGSSGGGMTNFNTTTDAALSLDALAGCAADTELAKELPLDLYFMIDTSDSMNDLVAAHESKWNAVVSAMNSFVNDQGSAGIGVGVQYFPLNAAGVPASCTSSAQCGAAGPCLLKACDLSVFSEVYPCDTSADCQGQACNPIGECANEQDVICVAGTGTCGADANGFDRGACMTLTSSTCSNGDSCAVQDYTTPAVPIAVLPGAANAVTASLASHQPNGSTPTSAALQGAIDGAKAFALANPAHSVVAVLATDGVPDECDPDDTAGIAAIAAAGLSGAPGIKTFVIGVFTPDDLTSGTAALDSIASAGGTKQPFIIQAGSANVEQQFGAALNAIRGASLPCQYEIPVPDGGAPNYDSVNVEYTSGAGVSSGVPYVETAARCSAGGGWYYDTDPAGGATPSAILVCPTTCSTLQGDAKGRVDVIIGCQTITK